MELCSKKSGTEENPKISDSVLNGYHSADTGMLWPTELRRPKGYLLIVKQVLGNYSLKLFPALVLNYRYQISSHVEFLVIVNNRKLTWRTLVIHTFELLLQMNIKVTKSNLNLLIFWAIKVYCRIENSLKTYCH